jgi:hypothetical protein
MDLLTTYTRHSEVQALTRLSLIFTLHKSPQHLLSLSQPTVSSSAVTWQRLLTVEIFQLHALRSPCHSRPCRALVNCQLNYSAICSQPPLQELTDSCPSSILFITPRHGPRREQPISSISCVTVAGETYRAVAQKRV